MISSLLQVVTAITAPPPAAAPSMRRYSGPSWAM